MALAQSTDMEVASGGLLNLVEPRAEHISLADIASALSNLCRYTGHGRTFYSVAQHSVLVADLVAPEFRVHALLHDAHEAYVGDISSPMKAALSALDPNFARAFWMLEKRIIGAIYEALNLELPAPGISAIVKKADMIALATEQREIMCSANDWGLPWPACGQFIRPLGPEQARVLFEDALLAAGLPVFGHPLDVAADMEDAA